MTIQKYNKRNGQSEFRVEQVTLCWSVLLGFFSLTMHLLG